MSSRVPIECPAIPDILHLLELAESRGTATPPHEAASAEPIERPLKRKAPVAPFLTWTRLSEPVGRLATDVPAPLHVSLGRQTHEPVLRPRPATATTPAPVGAPPQPRAGASSTHAAPGLLERLEGDLTAPVVRKNLKVMVPNPNISEFYVLPNGDEVGKFSVKYLLYLDQKSARKRRHSADES